MTRPEKIEAKVAEAVWTSRFSTPAWEKLSEEAREECRTIARDALAALSVEDLLSLAFTEEGITALAHALGSLNRNGTEYVGTFNIEDWKPYAEGVLRLLMERGSDAR